MRSAICVVLLCLLKWGKFGTFFACSAYNKKDKNSCTFTKENTEGKPDMNTPEAQEAEAQRGVLRELRPGDGAAARAVRDVHELPGVFGRPAVQDDSQALAKAAAKAAAADGVRPARCAART